MIASLKKHASSGRQQKSNKELKNGITEVNNKKPQVERQSSANTALTITANNQDSCLNGIGPYEFIKPLGSGKFSRVMLAHHLETQQQVAIKIIDKQAHDYRVMSRLVREISLMEILQHESIVKLNETYESCDSLFLVMEYVPGCNLDEYLQKKNNGALDEDEARQLFRQLIAAVDFCHRKWVVHRDLKTPNILIASDGQVKLADFGLGNRYGLQRLRTICGSMLYYSPEIITGQKYYGPEVDCWCLGITLFRMTAGFEPFAHAHTVGELKRDVCKCNFPMPSTLSPDLQATIRKCLQVDRRKRMTLRQVLKDDPWLTDNGKTPCPLSNSPKTIYEETMAAEEEKELREEKNRKQFMRDLEFDVQNPNKVKRTVIYHPINPSNYYTTKSGSTHSMISAGQHIQNVELLRSELLQSIRSRARRLRVKSVERWDLHSPDLKAFFSLSQKSTHSLADMVHRIRKDRVYHFQIGSFQNNTPSRPPSLTSSTSSASSSMIEDRHDMPIENDSMLFEKRCTREIMALLKQTCQLMGITYVQRSPVLLECVLTLRSAPKKSANSTTSSTTLTSATPAAPMPPPVSSRQSRKQSQTSSTATDETSSTRHYKRLSLPLISQLTSSMTTSFFGRSKPRHSLDETATITKPQQQMDKRKHKEGMAKFTIEIESHKKKVDRINLRFSKSQGSNTVFKMAGGWVAGVMALDGKIGR